MTEASQVKRATLAIAFALAISTPAKAADGLVLVPEGPLLVALIVGFIILVFPVNALIFKPLFRVLDEREKRIAGARARAAELEGEANELLERYREAVLTVREQCERDRHAELEAARTEQMSGADAARAEALGVLEQGRGEVDGWLAEARSELRQSAEPLAQVAAERVLGRGLS